MSACAGATPRLSRWSRVMSARSAAFAELVAVPATNLLLVPDELPFEAAALIEPSTVARHMLDLGRFGTGDTAVVFGAGSIGLMLVQWLRILGARVIVVTDLVAGNRDAALALGAHRALDPAQDELKQSGRRLSAQPHPR